MSLAPTARILPGVILGANVRVEDFCLLGVPPLGVMEGEVNLSVGDDSILRSHTVVYSGAHIGPRFRSGHFVLIRENTDVGADCSIGSGSSIEGSVTIGDRVRIHSHCFIPELSILESDAWLGPNVVVTNSRYPQSSDSKQRLMGIRIKRLARVGANVTLLPGVIVGEGALVGAGAVVTRDVKPGSIVVGNPARQIGLTGALQDDGVFVYPETPG